MIRMKSTRWPLPARWALRHGTAGLALLVSMIGLPGCQSPPRSSPPVSSTPRQPVQWHEAVKASREVTGRVGLAPPDPRFAQALERLPAWFPGAPPSLSPETIEWDPKTTATSSAGEWVYRTKTGNLEVSRLPEFPSFLAMHGELKRCFAAAIQQTPGGVPKRGLSNQVQSWLRDHHGEPSFLVLESLAATPLPWSAPEFLALSQSLVSIALETYDPMELLGSWEACAWAACAAAEVASGTEGYLPETILLAESLGYAPEAMEMARTLPQDHPARLKVLRQWNALADRAQSGTPLTPMDQSIYLFASEGRTATARTWPPSAFPAPDAPGALAATLASRARGTSGTEQIDAAAALFSFELLALRNQTSATTLGNLPNLTTILDAARSGGGLTGRYATAETSTPAALEPVLPGDLRLLPRRAAAFGALYLIGQAITTNRDLALQFDLVLGTPPMDTPVGLLTRVVRYLTVGRDANSDSDTITWRRFDHFVESAGRDTLVYRPDSATDRAPNHLSVLPPSRPRNRRDIRRILAGRELRQTDKIVRLLRVQAHPPGLDNADYQVITAILDRNPDQARKVLAAYPDSLEQTALLLGDLMEQQVLSEESVSLLLPDFEQLAAREPDRKVGMAALYQRMGRRSDTLRHLIDVGKQMLARETPRTRERILDQILWQSLMTSSTEDALRLNRELRGNDTTTGTPVRIMLDYLEGKPLPNYANGNPFLDVPMEPYVQTSASVAVALVFRAREQPSTALPSWLGAIPSMTPDFHEDGLRPAVVRALIDRPELSDQIGIHIRPRWLVPIALDVDRAGHTSTALALLQTSIAATTNPSTNLSNALVRLAIQSGEENTARSQFARTIAEIAESRDAQSSFFLACQTTETHPLRQALSILKETGQNGSNHPLPDAILRLPLTPSEGAFVLALTAYHRGQREEAEDLFRTLTLLLEPDPGSPVHQSAARFLRTLTQP
jgi:thioredoxin-like negative regulator of GroEL